MKKTILLIGVIAVVLLSIGRLQAFAQGPRGPMPPLVKITGTVTDETGPIIGAFIQVEGLPIGTSTNDQGIYFLEVGKGQTIVVSAIGYVSQKIKISDQTTINVRLVEDKELLEEVVVVGYGTQKKESLTSSISSIKSEEITNTKQSNVVSSLQGKVPGLLIRQNTDKPGAFDASISMRGFGTPIVVIDGVQASMADMQQINPNDIDNMSVLKDASASIYGLGAGNGVILITTKKGSIGRPQISISSTFSFGSPLDYDKKVDAVTFMNLTNEMAANSRQSQIYSDDYIQHFRNGDKGYVYTNWLNEVENKFALTQDYNFAIRGGNNQTKYYISLGYNDEGSIIKNNDLYYKRYTVMGNIETKLTENLIASFRTSVRITDKRDWNSAASVPMYYWLYISDPFVAPYTLNNPEHYSYVASEGRNLVALTNSDNGYQRTRAGAFSNNIEIRYTAPWLEGLSVVGQGSYDYSNSLQSTLMRTFPLYDYWTDAYIKNNDDKNTYNEASTTNDRLYLKLQANYNHRFGQHGINAMLASEMTVTDYYYLYGQRLYGSFFTHDVLSQADASQSTNSGTRSQTATAGYLGRINYDYAGKYMVELMGRYDGTYIYMRGKRWGFFPSYSVGWRASEEPFIKDNLPWLNNLKFRWSDGKTGSIQSSAYAYLGGYTAGNTYVFDSGSQLQGYYDHTVVNSILTWADIRLMDFGIDWEINHGIFGGSFDIFQRTTKGVAGTASTTVPDFYGITLPSQNLNSNKNVGMEIMLSHRNKIGDFSYNIQATATFARYMVTYLESEKDPHSVYSSHYAYWAATTVGRWSGATGLAKYQWAGGQFANLNEANASNIMYDNNNSQTLIIPGMYKLVDRNHNGVIDSQDQEYVWYSSSGIPPLQYGLQISATWKNFDFSAVFSGGALWYKSVMMSGSHGFGFFKSIPTRYLDRYRLANGYTDPWDPESQWTSGYWPALTTSQSAYTSKNSTYTNNQDYNVIDASYIRLKSVVLGYTVPQNITRKVGVGSFRVFVTGSNLLTICNPLIKAYDPEQNDWFLGTGYPLMRTIIVGLNMNF